MIQNLKIHNFQAHKDLKLELKPGINLILGDSNIGKTSIIRALQLLLTGSPKSPIYASGNPVKVKMTLNDKVYSVEKTIRKNKVTKTIWNIDNQIYDGANYKPDIGLSDINIQSQFDPFYMISKTPGLIGKEIQIVTGVDLADKIKSKLNPEINNLKTNIARLENNIELNKKELSEYPDLKKIKKTILLYEKVTKRIKKEEEKIQQIEELSLICNRLEGVICTQKEKIKHLESVSDKIEKCKQELIKIQEEKESNYIIIKLIEKTINLKSNIKQSKFKIKKLKKQYKNCLGDLCPTCGNEIDKEKLERIL
jgi:exonuclease SbcC